MEHTVVLVHGIFDTGKIFAPMARYFAGHGLRTHAPDLRPCSGAQGLEMLARQLKQVIDTLDAQIGPESTLDLVGFSMGGLISRYYLQRLGGLERVRRFVAISVPQHGSRWAWFLPNQGCRQMRPGSPFLQDLNQDIASLAQIDLLTLWTPLDLMIIPAGSSVIPVGRECKIPVLLHDWMIKDSRVLKAMADFLLEPEPVGPVAR